MSKSSLLIDRAATFDEAVSSGLVLCGDRSDNLLSHLHSLLLQFLSFSLESSLMRGGELNDHDFLLKMEQRLRVVKLASHAILHLVGLIRIIDEVEA
jgi:hypothetical protein